MSLQMCDFASMSRGATAATRLAGPPLGSAALRRSAPRERCCHQRFGYGVKPTSEHRPCRRWGSRRLGGAFDGRPTSGRFQSPLRASHSHGLASATRRARISPAWALTRALQRRGEIRLAQGLQVGAVTDRLHCPLEVEYTGAKRADLRTEHLVDLSRSLSGALGVQGAR